MDARDPRPRGEWPSRGEVEQAVATAFAGARPSRDELLAAAVAAYARPAVIAFLCRLPRRRFRDVDDVWTALSDLDTAGADT